MDDRRTRVRGRTSAGAATSGCRVRGVGPARTQSGGGREWMERACRSHLRNYLIVRRGVAPARRAAVPPRGLDVLERLRAVAEEGERVAAAPHRGRPPLRTSNGRAEARASIRRARRVRLTTDARTAAPAATSSARPPSSRPRVVAAEERERPPRATLGCRRDRRTHPDRTTARLVSPNAAERCWGAARRGAACVCDASGCTTRTGGGARARGRASEGERGGASEVPPPGPARRARYPLPLGSKKNRQVMLFQFLKINKKADTFLPALAGGAPRRGGPHARGCAARDPTPSYSSAPRTCADGGV